MSIACATVLLSVSACSADPAHTALPPQPQDSTTPVPATDGTVPGTTRPSPLKPPEPEPGASLAGRQKVTAGNAVVPYDKGRKGDALTVAVSCQGKGRITVAVRPVHVSFPLECDAGQVSTVSNEFAVSGVERGGVVTIEAPQAVRWSLTVGRGAPTEADARGDD
ncbi:MULTISPECIES: hypothetical protein [unclassified Streptomyces]|uniref:hypothetical protein n=1 Tax=unclassified Streptomyces TaxID=2593676 RepID=UPI0033EBD377